MYFCSMNISRIITFTCLILGGIIAIYAQAQEKQNTYILMIGIVLLMAGVYRLARNIPSKFDDTEDSNFNNSENEI